MQLWIMMDCAILYLKTFNQNALTTFIPTGFVVNLFVVYAIKVKITIKNKYSNFLGAVITINTLKPGFTIQKIYESLKLIKSDTFAAKIEGNRILIVFAETLAFTGNSLIEANQIYHTLTRVKFIRYSERAKKIIFCDCRSLILLHRYRIASLRTTFTLH